MLDLNRVGKAGATKANRGNSCNNGRAYRPLRMVVVIGGQNAKVCKWLVWVGGDQTFFMKSWKNVGGHLPCLFPGIYVKMFDQMKIFLWPLMHITCQNSYVATKLENTKMHKMMVGGWLAKIVKSNQFQNSLHFSEQDYAWVCNLHNCTTRHAHFLNWIEE